MIVKELTHSTPYSSVRVRAIGLIDYITYSKSDSAI